MRQNVAILQPAATGHASRKRGTESFAVAVPRMSDSRILSRNIMPTCFGALEVSACKKQPVRDTGVRSSVAWTQSNPLHRSRKPACICLWDVDDVEDLSGANTSFILQAMSLRR